LDVAVDRTVTAPDAHWAPAQIRWTAAGPLVDWCHLGGLRFTAPFFEQTIGTAMAHPFNLLFRRSTPLAALEEISSDLRPAGLIFHMSRCGSTLLTQMLAALPQNVVLSEPGPLDQVLRLPARLQGVTPDRLIGWLRGMTAALARRRTPEERDFFIKFEGWHVLMLPLIRRAFPGVPWVFLYREPLDVMASLALARPNQMMFGGLDPALLGVEAAQAAAMSSDRYCALVLEHICRAAIAHMREGGGLLIEYRELPEPALTRVIDHFRLRYGAEEMAAMRARAGFNAKQPARRYIDESNERRRAVSEEIRSLAANLLAPLYERMEELRTMQ
jgi:hypothetical protein